MTHTETQDTTARVAAPGAPVAPPQARATKGASQKPAAAENACGRQNKSRAEKGVKGWYESGPREAGRLTAP